MYTEIYQQNRLPCLLPTKSLPRTQPVYLYQRPACPYFVECAIVAGRRVLPGSVPREDRWNALHYPRHIRTGKGIADNFTHSLHLSPGHQQRLNGTSTEEYDIITACKTYKWITSKRRVHVRETRAPPSATSQYPITA